MSSTVLGNEFQHKNIEQEKRKCLLTIHIMNIGFLEGLAFNSHKPRVQDLVLQHCSLHEPQQLISGGMGTLIFVHFQRVLRKLISWARFTLTAQQSRLALRGEVQARSSSVPNEKLELFNHTASSGSGSWSWAASDGGPRCSAIQIFCNTSPPSRPFPSQFGGSASRMQTLRKFN